MKRKPLNVVSILHGLTTVFARNDVGDDIRRELDIHPKIWNRFLDDYDKEPIQTVTIVEIFNGKVEATSFMNSFAGKYAAERLFRKLVKKYSRGYEWSEAAIQGFIDMGVFSDESGCEVLITHSV